MTRARDVANLIGSGNYSSTTFTATAGQTVFSIAHTQNFVQVFMNGLLLDLTVDYTSNGSAVTLTSGAAAGDEIEVVAYNTFSVGDALNQAAADTRYVNTAGDSMTGALSISSQNSKLNASSNHLILHDTAETDTGSNWWYMYRASGDGALRFYKGADRLKINASGHVTMPSQPMFDAYLTASSTHSSGVYNLSTGDSWATRANIGNHFSSGTFTAPVDGRYLFTANITANGSVGAMAYFGCEFQVNGSRRYIHWWGKGGSTSSYFAANN